MYFNVNFNVFFKLIKVHLLVSELYIHQNARCNDKNYFQLVAQLVLMVKHVSALSYSHPQGATNFGEAYSVMHTLSSGKIFIHVSVIPINVQHYYNRIEIE